MRGLRFGRVAFGIVTALGVVVAASCSSDPPVVKVVGCTLNSDCNTPLVCVYQRCHAACKDSGDCPPGERCVAGNSAEAPNVCQLPVESSCATESCSGNQVCTAEDKQCRSPCHTTTDCVGGDLCEPSGTQSVCYDTTNGSDRAVLVAKGVLEAGAAGATGMSEGGSSGTNKPGMGSAGAETGGSGDNGGSSSVMPDAGFDAGTCVVHFGGVALGDTLPGFTTGIATRTPTGLLLLNGYTGADSDGGKQNDLHLQSFSIAGKSAGASAPSLVTRDDQYAGIGDWVQAAATSPGGTTMVMYYDISTYGNSQAPQIAFFDAKGKPLADPVALGPEDTVKGQPDLQWVKDRFVLAWVYNDGSGYSIKLAMFGSDGTMLTGIGPVPTDDAASHVTSTGGGDYIVSLAASDATLAVAYRSTNDYEPTLTLLDLSGNTLGAPVHLAQAASAYGLAIAGTENGFIGVWHEYNTTPDASADLLGNGFGHAVYVSRAGKVGADLRLPGAVAATVARGSSDGTNAGFALLYTDGVHFATAGDNLTSGVRVSNAIASSVDTNAQNDQISISNTGAGTFSLSLYSSTEHRTRAVAEGCTLLGD